MNARYGWSGKILLIDLTRKTHRIVETEPYLPFLGGRGINQRLLFDRVDKDTEALDPEAPLIFGAGPMVGTPVPGANSACGRL